MQEDIQKIELQLLELEKKKFFLLDSLSEKKHEFRRNGILSGLDQLKYPKTPEERIELFSRLFVARYDVFPLMWENSHTGHKGYSPVCDKVWEDGRYLKPTEIFKKFGRKKFRSLDASQIEAHLRGQQTVGSYAVRPDNTCIFLAADFDKGGWEQDALTYRETCLGMGVSPLMEISRSGNGAHVWILFSEPVPATKARLLGDVILAKASRKNPSINLDSYDRFFPNQDFIPKGGFGNLIALPLQKHRRKEGFTEFVDHELKPYPDQWEILSQTPRLSFEELKILLDEEMVADAEDDGVEIQNQILESNRLDSFQLPIVSDWKIHISESLNIPTNGLSPAFIGELKRLATIPNPIFFEKQRQRFPTYNIPKYVFAGEFQKDILVLPRGCSEDVVDLFADCGSRVLFEDRRLNPTRISLKFKGNLKSEQMKAVNALKEYENGVLVAPPGAGKTVMACSVIASRKVATLILVNRQTLVDQWIERLVDFLDITKKEIGVLGGTRRKLKGKVDIAMIQSLARNEAPAKLFREYGMVIVDECHHVPAVSLESLLKQCGSKYLLGLTATPKRKDRLEKLLYFQCGPIRHVFSGNDSKLQKRVNVRETGFRVVQQDDQVCPLHMVWEQMITDSHRNRLIAMDAYKAAKNGSVPLVLSDRKEHLRLIGEVMSELGGGTEFKLFSIDGSLANGERKSRVDGFQDAISLRKPACLLATASLLGEGFDMPELNTLLLAMPVSFRGRVVQYAGRLHREAPGKEAVKVIDYLDKYLPVANSMFRKRSAGYREMGYEIVWQQ